MTMFHRAERKASRLRIGLESPSGGGKTYTALKIATVIAAHDKGGIAVIDSERGSSAKYSEGSPFDFDLAILNKTDPKSYIDAILEAERQHYAVIIIDSASHEWRGTLKMVEEAGSRMKGNRWAGWSEGRPAHEAFIDAIIGVQAHVIATYRSKQASEQRKDENNRTVIEKLGLQAVAADDTDYEFDVWGSIAHDTQQLMITKSRLYTIPIHSQWDHGEGLAEAYIEWLNGAQYETPEKSPDMMRALIREAVAEAGLDGAAIGRVVGTDGALKWLATRENDIAALIKAAQTQTQEKD